MADKPEKIFALAAILSLPHEGRHEFVPAKTGIPRGSLHEAEEIADERGTAYVREDVVKKLAAMLQTIERGIASGHVTNASLLDTASTGPTAELTTLSDLVREALAAYEEATSDG